MDRLYQCFAVLIKMDSCKDSGSLIDGVSGQNVSNFSVTSFH